MNTENKCWKPGQIIVKAQVTESQPLKTARAESLSASGTVTLTSPFQVPVKQNTLFLTTLWQPVKTAQVRASRGYLSRVYCKRGASHHGLAETGSQGRKKALQWEREKSGERWSEAVGTGSCNGAADSVSCVIGSGCVLLFHWSRLFFLSVLSGKWGQKLGKLCSWSSPGHIGTVAQGGEARLPGRGAACCGLASCKPSLLQVVGQCIFHLCSGRCLYSASQPLSNTIKWPRKK